MDETSLEESLNGYKEQLNQISLLLETSDELTKLELYDLEKDLKELISVTEDSLLSLKKEKLLSLVTGDENTTSLGIRPTKTIGESTSEEKVDEENIEEDDFVGTKCRVKYTQEWGSFQYHNAMVLGVEIDEEAAEDNGNVKVRVLFLNPIHKTMVPCKYFLEGKCNFISGECRYSHGYLVDVDELLEYEEPDFTKLEVGGECLAKYEKDGVWYKAEIENLHDEQVTISFHSYKETLTLDYHSVIPIGSYKDKTEELSDDSDVDTNDDISTSEGMVQLSFKSTSMAGPLGEWEEHTRGIGSKLMAKMGYIFGKGLGKNGEGRVEPVEIRLLPPGKSLDKIAELREKGFIKDPVKKKKTQKQLAAEENRLHAKKKRETAAFDLINRLSKRSSNASSNHSTKINTKFSIEDTYKSFKKTDNGKQRQQNKHGGQSNSMPRGKNNQQKDINFQVFQNSEKAAALRKKLSKQKEALARNPGNSTVSRTIKENIMITERELEEALNVERALQSKVHMKNQSKKLSIF